MASSISPDDFHSAHYSFLLLGAGVLFLAFLRGSRIVAGRATISDATRIDLALTVAVVQLVHDKYHVARPRPRSTLDLGTASGLLRHPSGEAMLRTPRLRCNTWPHRNTEQTPSAHDHAEEYRLVPDGSGRAMDANSEYAHALIDRGPPSIRRTHVPVPKPVSLRVCRRPLGERHSCREIPSYPQTPEV
jgi:hypothetical protein